MKSSKKQKIDTSAYIKRMEEAVFKANIAMGILKEENEKLKARIIELELRGEVPNQDNIVSMPTKRTQRTDNTSTDVNKKIKSKKDTENSIEICNIGSSKQSIDSDDEIILARDQSVPNNQTNDRLLSQSEESQAIFDFFGITSSDSIDICVGNQPDSSIAKVASSNPSILSALANNPSEIRLEISSVPVVEPLDQIENDYDCDVVENECETEFETNSRSSNSLILKPPTSLEEFYSIFDQDLKGSSRYVHTFPIASIAKHFFVLVTSTVSKQFLILDWYSKLEKLETIPKNIEAICPSDFHKKVVKFFDFFFEIQKYRNGRRISQEILIYFESKLLSNVMKSISIGTFIFGQNILDIKQMLDCSSCKPEEDIDNDNDNDNDIDIDSSDIHISKSINDCNPPPFIQLDDIFDTTPIADPVLSSSNVSNLVVPHRIRYSKSSLLQFARVWILIALYCELVRQDCMYLDFLCYFIPVCLECSR